MNVTSSPVNISNNNQNSRKLGLLGTQEFKHRFV